VVQECGQKLVRDLRLKQPLAASSADFFSGLLDPTRRSSAGSMKEAIGTPDRCLSELDIKSRRLTVLSWMPSGGLMFQPSQVVAGAERGGVVAAAERRERIGLLRERSSAYRYSRGQAPLRDGQERDRWVDSAVVLGACALFWVDEKRRGRPRQARRPAGVKLAGRR
jgi:hypothetical protein